MGGYVYIIANKNNGPVYVGVTSKLKERVRQHITRFYPNSYSARHDCTKLVYYHWYETIEEAIREEKRIKGGSRRKKEILIETINQEWKDLYPDILEGNFLRFPRIHRYK